MSKKERKFRRLLSSLQRYVTFFLMVAFIVTCCMLLFVSQMISAMELTLTQADIQFAAKITLGNVLLLSAVFTLIDRLRRKFMIDRPVRQIVRAGHKLMQGDFSTRVPRVHSIDPSDGFVEVADCFNRMAEELSGTETLRTDFIANVSHELKTPLAVMQNYATMLQQPGLDEVRRIEYARAISDTSRRLASLITNVLKLNKLENQQIFPTRTVYDLGEQLAQCLLTFEDIWEKKHIDICTDIAENVLVDCDEELLSLVWNNLFSNAFKFTGEGGTVSLSLFIDNDMAVVQVADTGCGFGSDIGQHIFEKFYQGDTSHATQGNGLGLALVKRVVDILSGDIAVTSEIGKGSTFTVRIPRTEQGEIKA